MTKLKAETWDNMQKLFRNYFDGTMHSVFFYDGTLDADALAEAYAYVAARIPVLHSTFCARPVKSFWRVNDDYQKSDYFFFEETDEPARAVDEFVTRTVDPKGKVQFFAKLVRHDGKDALVVIVNHMCFDGGDLRYFNLTVAECYNELKATGKITVKVKDGTRCAEQLYDGMNEEDKKTAKGLMSNVSAVKNEARYPFAAVDKSSERTRIVLRKIDKELFSAVKAKGKEERYSVNDLFLSAYIKTIYKFCKLTPEQGVSLSCMCDLRRYLPDHATKGSTNMTGFMPCAVKNVGTTMRDVLAKVKEQTDIQKADRFMGMYSIPLLTLAYKLFPYCLAQTAIRIGFQNPLFGMSNIGIIKPAEFELDGVKLADAWYTGAVKYKPYVQLAMTTFEGEVTMSIAIRGNSRDQVVAEKFLADVENNLRDYAFGA